MTKERPWVALKDVCGDYGMKMGSARNAIKAGRFPVPTYKLGKLIVIDLAVHEEFFANKRKAGLRALRNNRMVNEHCKGDDDAA